MPERVRQVCATRIRTVVALHRSGPMASRRLRLTFPAGLVTEPVIYSVGRRYEVVTNIRRANIDKQAGWMVLEMTGEDEALAGAIAYLEETGVEVEPVEGDIVAS